MGPVLPGMWGEEAWRCAGNPEKRHRSLTGCWFLVFEWIWETACDIFVIDLLCFWLLCHLGDGFSCRRFWRILAVSHRPSALPGHSSFNDKCEEEVLWWNMKTGEEKGNRSRSGSWMSWFRGEWQGWPVGDAGWCPGTRSSSPNQPCWQENGLLWFCYVFGLFSCHWWHSSLILFPVAHPPSARLSLWSLSRRPSLRSALECCFYIAASGGMWSFFWTALQTDGGFHAAFMRLSETFPWKKTFPCVLSPSLCLSLSLPFDSPHLCPL